MADLSEQGLRTKFVRPYRKGATELVDGVAVDFMTLTSVKIIGTARPKEEELELLGNAQKDQIDEFNSDGSLIRFPMGIYDEDIAGAGDDVTLRYVKGAPGYGARRWAWTQNGLTIAIVVGLVVTVVGGVILAMVLKLPAFAWLSSS